jgi:hypothetical protein
MNLARVPIVLSVLLLSLTSGAAWAAEPAPSRTTEQRVVDLGVRYDDVSAFAVEISGVNAGYVRVSAQGAPATIIDTTGAMGGTANLFEMAQDLAIVIDITSAGLTSEPVRLGGGRSDARLRSVATDWAFAWEPVVSSSGRCVAAVGGRGEETCAEYHVTHELSGLVTDATLACGSMTHRMTYAIALDGDEASFAGFVSGGGGFDASGRLSVTSGACRDAIFGVMPGDNITLSGPQSARIVVDGVVVGARGGQVVADVEFVGRLQNGLPIAGRGEATLRFDHVEGLRTATATGELRFVGTLGSGDAAREVEGRGRLELAGVVLTGDTFGGAGTAEVIASTTEGGSVD